MFVFSIQHRQVSELRATDTYVAYLTMWEDYSANMNDNVTAPFVPYGDYT